MKMPNKIKKQGERLKERWSEEDYPGGTPRFQLSLLAKDIAVFGLTPICAILFYKIVEGSILGREQVSDIRRTTSKLERNEPHSQIIHFQSSRSGERAISKRAPGTLVKVRLLNVVETLSTAPVHAQVIDAGLGREFMGGTLIGEATSEAASGRVKIDFKFLRHSRRLDLAVPISARAMSLDGTFGIVATKKEGVFARAAIRSSTASTNTSESGNDGNDLKTMIAKAFAAGLIQELREDASVAHNNAQVMRLAPMTEFFVELTDYFPGQKK